MDTPTWLQHPSQQDLRALLLEESHTWLVTGAAGFIGSHLVETLLRMGQQVKALDNFITGQPRNLQDVRANVGEKAWSRFHFMEGDIRDFQTCAKAVASGDYVLHQAALGSVPRSVADPIASHEANVTGFIHMLEASRQAGALRFVYAASSSTYGDEPHLPKREERIGKPLSPYAATKLMDEIYADVYARTYGFGSVGLRYFNVFGPRQAAAGAYAAVIPKWAAAMFHGQPVSIHGDGETSRDFCYIDNVVQANLRGALLGQSQRSEVFNVAVGEQTTLNELFSFIRDTLQSLGRSYAEPPQYRPFRGGDVRHSLADISKIRDQLSYHPLCDLRTGITCAVPWYVNDLGGRPVA